ncbi:MAG TPA: class I SAM-dependent methyltransferase [Verrucomicrobia bacterium]|nr:class I SAM-dependent methyltransferase [Verrucomicrobiota bacterium]
MMSIAERCGASFRDPGGFVFRREGVYYRQVNDACRADYDLLMSSGLYSKLTSEGLLIPHEEEPAPGAGPSAYKVIRPRQLAFVGYPYEWSFSQLKDAALLTLRVQKIAMAAGLSLKDASAYNVQLHEGRPIFIDTLSFEKYDETKPWVAYRQFCQHFLAPLALMAHKDIRLGQLLRIYIDGIPLPLASRLLPWRTVWNIGLTIHLHLHARSQEKYADNPRSLRQNNRPFRRPHLEALLGSLETTIRRLRWRGGDTEWADYYEANNNYGAEGLEAKARIVGRLLSLAQPRTVWDLGANTGRFSRVAAQAGASTVVSWDIDPSCVEANYRQVTRHRESAIVPLLLDLTNPTPSLGWANAERMSMAERGPADAVLALGLIHHLAIGNNVPLPHVAAFLARLGRHLVIEWVPREDSQVMRLLASRKDVFSSYTQSAFEQSFGEFFRIECSEPVPGTLRTLYLMKTL